MRFLITNDDGYDAPGLLALYHALRELGDVEIVAPAECHSSKGHAVVTHETIRVENRQLDGAGRIFVVHSSPADCVRMALAVLLDSPPDFVVAGINPGANMGVDVYYSGTVAAAREATIMGVPGIAVSQYTRPDIPLDWNAVSRLATETLAAIVRQPIAAGEFWNVNFPSTPADEVSKPLVYVRQCTEAHAVQFEAAGESAEAREFRYVGNYQQRGASPDGDVRSVFDGHVTATRLQLDLTAR